MKKLLIVLALFTFAALGAQDALIGFWFGDAAYNFHVINGPDGNPGVDGWAFH